MAEGFVKIQMEVHLKEEGSYSHRMALGVKIDHDVLPPEVDPVYYLRHRVMSELARITEMPVPTPPPSPADRQIRRLGGRPEGTQNGDE